MSSRVESAILVTLLAWTLEPHLAAEELVLWEQSFGLENVQDVHIRTTGRSHIIAGTRSDTVHGNVVIYFMRLDQAGGPRARADISGEDFSSYTMADLALGPDGEVVIVGTLSMDNDCGPATTKGFILRTDSDGNRLTESLHGWVPSSVTTLRKTVIVAGTLANGDPFLRAGGNEWELGLHTPGTRTGVVATRTANDVAVALLLDYDLASREGKNRLLAVDDAGTIVWQNSMGPRGFSGTGLLTGGDRIHVVGTRRDEVGGRIALLEVDMQGRQRWDRTYLPFEGRGLCVGRSARGDILVGGWIQEAAEKEGILLTLDEEGALVGQKRLSRQGASSSVRSVLTTPDGYLVSCIVGDRYLSEKRWAKRRPVFIGYRHFDEK